MTTENIARRVIFTPYRKGCGPSFTLTMWDDVGYDSQGKIRIRYRLNMSGAKGHPITLFAGADFATPHASDSDETVLGLMGFLTLRPGDTDADYFAGYSAVQLAYCADHAEALSMEVESRFGERSDESDESPPTSTPPSGSNGPVTGTGVIRDDLQLCTDCLFVAVNGDVSHIQYSYGSGPECDARIAEIEAGLESLGPNLVPDFDAESGEGHEEFATHRCDCCGWYGGAEWHRFAVLGSKTLDQIDESDVVWEVIVEPEIESIEGNASAVDPATDRETAEWIRDQLESGNDLAWCSVRVIARWNNMEGSDSLGCVSVESQQDLEDTIAAHAMRRIALAALKGTAE